MNNLYNILTKVSQIIERTLFNNLIARIIIFKIVKIIKNNLTLS